MSRLFEALSGFNSGENTRVLMLGLDAAGKTTILYKVSLESEAAALTFSFSHNSYNFFISLYIDLCILSLSLSLSLSLWLTEMIASYLSSGWLRVPVLFLQACLAHTPLSVLSLSTLDSLAHHSLVDCPAIYLSVYLFIYLSITPPSNASSPLVLNLFHFKFITYFHFIPFTYHFKLHKIYKDSASSFLYMSACLSVFPHPLPPFLSLCSTCFSLAPPPHSPYPSSFLLLFLTPLEIQLKSIFCN